MLVSISIAQSLKVKPAKAARYLKVSIGQKILKNDLIAVKKDLLGKVVEVLAEVDGTISSFSEQTGELSMEVNSRGETKESESLEFPDKQIKTAGLQKPEPKPKVSKNKIGAFFGFGMGTGELVVCERCLEFLEVKKEHKGKVILAPSISTKASFYKSSAIGAAGLVILSLDEKGVTEIEDIDGKGKIGFLALGEKESKELWDKITKWKGKTVRIDGEKKEVILISNG